MTYHSHMRHHPNTSESARLIHHHSHGHGLPFNATELKAVFEKKEFAPNQQISRFGLQNATQVMSYLASTEGKLVKSAIVEEIELMISQLEENKFEATEAMAHHRRTLAFLLMRYLHAREHEKHVHEIEQFIHDALEADSHLPVPVLAKDTHQAYLEMQEAIQKDIELQNELSHDLEEHLENIKTFERHFEDLLKKNEEESKDLEKNPGETLGDVLMAICLAFSEQLESELEQTNKQIDSLQQKQNPSLKLKGPQPASDVRQLHQLKAKHALQTETLAQLKQAQNNISQMQQAQKTPQAAPAPHLTAEPRPALRQEIKQLLNPLQQHREGMEMKHASLGTRIGRLATERNQLSSQERAVMKQYDVASRKLQLNRSRPSMAPRMGHEAPKPRPR